MAQPVASAAPYTDPAAIFAGTATDYAQYRVPHPQQVAAYITHLSRQHAPAPRMADLGCGPGTLTLELAARGVDMIAVDPNADMLAAGRSQAAARGLLGIDWRTGTAEQIAAQPGVRGLTAAVMPDSFHWMNRSVVLEQLNYVIAPSGFVAVVCSRALNTPRPWWYDVIARVRARYVGPEPAAGVGTAYQQSAGDHEAVLRRSAFARVSVMRYDYPLRYTIDSLVGQQRTYAYSSRPLLAERHAEFEKELAAALQVVEPSGELEAWAQGAVIVGRRE